jgi:two-component system heavy metal sensor histidine kinase CusS
MYSLRRTLAVRFSLTMFAALLLIALWAYLGAHQTLVRELESPADAAERLETANWRLIGLLAGTVVLGSLATMFGASWLAASAVTPIAEIAAQARATEVGSVGHRITAHADVAEYEGLVEVLNGLLERLDKAFLTQRRMIADVGHDLRTPITAMRGELEIALRGDRTPDVYRRTLSSVLEETDRLGAIAESLVLLARLEAGEATPAREPTDIAALADAAVARARANADHHILRRAPVEGSAITPLDAKMSGLVLNHLLDNALRHTPGGTTIDLRVCAEPQGTKIVVSDNGPGVEPAVLPHLFERFYRGDSARGRGAGAGLGLTLVAAVAKAHGGTVQAAAAEPSGLSVTVWLPISS